MYNTTYQQYMVEEGIQELTSLCITQRTNMVEEYKYMVEEGIQELTSLCITQRTNNNTTYQMVEEGIQELTSLCITQRTNNTWWRRAYKS